MSNSGYTCVRVIFCTVNVLFWLSGCTLLAAGIWLRVSYEGYSTLLPQYALISADSLAIFVGAIIVILSFFACCGSWCQNRCMLITYFGLVVFMFVAEFMVGSMAFIFREGLSHTLREELQNGIIHHYNMTSSRGPNSLVTIWDHIQTDFRCCGVQNYEDWHMIDAWPEEKWVPDSCCLPADFNESCGKTSSPDHFYTEGCYRKIHIWFTNRLYIVGFLGLMVAFVQLFGLISSMLLFCTVKHKISSRTYKSYS